MRRRIKNTIQFVLVTILVLPMVIKLIDSVHHQHYNHYYQPLKNAKHLVEYHKKCAIPGYELSLFSSLKQVHTTQKHQFSVEIYTICDFVYCCNNSKYSFLLRAPPLLSGTEVIA